MNNRVTDYSGHGVAFHGTKCVEVDFTDSATYSLSASDTTGYFDVAEELGTDWAFVHLESAAKLTVVFVDDNKDTGEVLFPFQAGTNIKHKISRIYYDVDNTATSFYLVYS